MILSQCHTPATHFAACHHLQCDSQKTHTEHHRSPVLRLRCKMKMNRSKVVRLPRKMKGIFWRRCKSIAFVTQNEFWHLMKHAGMSPGATAATRKEVAESFKPPKVTTLASIPIGTAIVTSHKRLRPVANDGATSSTPSTSKHPEWNGKPCYTFGKNM